jgi:hypothetical protein
MLKALSLLHRNIRRLEKALNKERVSSRSTPEAVVYRGEPFELDTLELARRGRQEQARVIAELTSAGLSRLARWGRQIYRAAESFVSSQMHHGLKGN